MSATKVRGKTLTSMDFRGICRDCGAYAKDPKDPKWPLCERCENDPDKKRRRRLRRDYRRSQWARERAWRLGIKGKYYPRDVDRLRKVQDNRCAYCEIELNRDTERVDHIIPLSRGGDNTPSNLQLLCPACNTAKSNLTDEEFREKIQQQP